MKRQHIIRAADARAFCLADLLITIAMIAILAAILFPVFARAREKARAATCTSNLVNIALALRNYAADNDMRYPPRDNDLSPLWPVYVNTRLTFACPSISAGKPMGMMPADEPPQPSTGGPPPPPDVSTTTPPGPPVQQPPPAAMPPPEDAPEVTLETGYFYVSGYRYDQFIRRMPLSGDSGASRHNDRANVLFTDGSLGLWTRADYLRAGLQRYAWMDD